MQGSPGPGKRGSFDFVHIRRLAGVVNHWRELILGAYKPTKSGRYLEVAEYEMKLYYTATATCPKGRTESTGTPTWRTKRRPPVSHRAVHQGE